MYALDWITFLLHINVTCLSDNFKDDDMLASIAYVQKLNRKDKKDLKEIFDGGHLLVSNRVGNCFEETTNSTDTQNHNGTQDHNSANQPKDKKKQCKRSVEFLKLLLQPDIEEKIHNLSRYIFDRWVGLMRVAALEHKEPASIRARFVAIPTEVKPTLFYALDGQVKEKLQAAADNIRQHIPNDLSLSFSIELLEEEWKRAIKFANESVNILHQRQENLDKIPITVFGFNDEIPTNLTELRPHPQRLFTVYVDLSSPDARMFFEIHNPLLMERSFPGPNHSDSIKSLDYQIRQMSDESDDDTLKTTLTERFIEAARYQPCCRTQNAIMGGQSATRVAETIFGGPQIRSAEWLHRFAFSFGGGGVPDNAQTQKNLVFGTYETNTDMIRYETCLKILVPDAIPLEKCLVKEVPKSVQLIELETTLADNKVGDTTFPWLTKTLVYKWQYPHPLKPARIVNMRHDFNLFSRKAPTRYEVDVDAVFDRLWMDTSSQDWRTFRYAVYWILFAQSL